jgi:hypothetical protein
MPFGEQDGLQIETLQKAPSQAIGSSETDPSHHVKTFLGLVAFHSALGNILLRWMMPVFISRINTNKSSFRTMKISQQLNAKRSAVRKQY